MKGGRQGDDHHRAVPYLRTDLEHIRLEDLLSVLKSKVTRRWADLQINGVHIQENFGCLSYSLVFPCFASPLLISTYVVGPQPEKTLFVVERDGTTAKVPSLAWGRAFGTTF